MNPGANCLTTACGWSVDQIRQLEARGLRTGLPLMQRAGECVVNYILEQQIAAQRTLVLAGPGNNGGDALTVAYKLLNLGFGVQVIMPQMPAVHANDAQQARATWNGLGQTTHKEWLHTDAAPDLIIDGLFGIGLNRALKHPWATLVDHINKSPAPVLALDIPSGLHAETGQPLGCAVQAHWTVAFIAPTKAVCNPQAAPWIGHWHVCTLGLQMGADRDALE